MYGYRFSSSRLRSPNSPPTPLHHITPSHPSPQHTFITITTITITINTTTTITFTIVVFLYMCVGSVVVGWVALVGLLVGLVLASWLGCDVGCAHDVGLGRTGASVSSTSRPIASLVQLPAVLKLQRSRDAVSTHHAGN